MKNKVKEALQPVAQIYTPQRDEFIGKIDAALTAAGYWIAPIEPTEAMINASDCECYGHGWDEHLEFVESDYTAMREAWENSDANPETS